MALGFLYLFMILAIPVLHVFSQRYRDMLPLFAHCHFTVKAS